MTKLYFLVFFLCIRFSLCAQSAGNFVSFEKLQESLIIQGTTGVLKIQVYTSEIFKVQFLNSKNTGSLDSSYSVNFKPEYFKPSRLSGLAVEKEQH